MSSQIIRSYSGRVLVLTITVAAVYTIVYFNVSKSDMDGKLGDIETSISKLSLDIKGMVRGMHFPVEVRTEPLPQSQPFKKMPSWHGIAYKRTNGSWVADDSMCSEDEVYDEATLKTPAGNTSIFIHAAKDDGAVSKSLKNRGVWEPDVMYTSFEILKENKDHVFIDVGGNVGTFSLAAAKLGNRVISVEPYDVNTKRLCRGVVKGGFAGQMFVIHNAMSDVRQPIAFKLYKGSIARTRIEKKASHNLNSDSVTTIQMNDVLEMFDIKSAVLKLDCEDHEVQVMKGAEAFFNVVDVRMVIFEWNKLYRNPETPYIIEMMKRFKLKPYTIGKNAEPLNNSDYTRSRRNIVFKKE